MKLPSNEEIRQIHEKYSPNQKAMEDVYSHSEIVLEIANELIDSSGILVDRELVRAGALLHDVGVYSLYDEKGEVNDDEYVRHGVLGYETLKKEGFDEAVCRLASHHTGMGLTKEMIGENSLPLPAEDFLAESEEEKLLMYADKFHSKTEPPQFNSFDYYYEYAKRFGDENAEKFKKMGKRFGVLDVVSIAKLYKQKVR